LVRGLDARYNREGISSLACEVEFTHEFEDWWDSLDEAEQDSVTHVVRLLQEAGPTLARPFADTLKGSKLRNLRELRIQHQGRPYRVLYVFDPRRKAILLVGGDKTGDGRWYVRMIPLAEEIYAEYLREVAEEEGR